MLPVRTLLLMLAALALVACSDRTTALIDAALDPDGTVGLDAAGDGPAHADAALDSAPPTPDGPGPTPDVGKTDTVAPCGKLQTDSFKQQLNRKVDILFVIDSSGSMMDEKPRLVATAPAFAAAAAANKLDFQLGSVGMSKHSGAFTLGKLHGDPRYITKTTPDLQGEFKERIDLPSGAGTEIGFDAIVAALSPALTGTINASSCTPCAAPNICAGGGCRGPNWGFRRAGASLELLFFTDEDDGSSATTPAQVLAALKAQVTPKQGQFVRVHGLLPLGSCAGASASFPRWKGLSSATGGKLHDLCAASYSAAIKDLTDRVFGLQDQFFLSQPPKAGTIKVLVGGKATTAFTHDASSNSVSLTTPPADGVNVAISYEVACP